jgi:hypothetical protein
MEGNGKNGSLADRTNAAACRTVAVVARPYDSCSFCCQPTIGKNAFMVIAIDLAQGTAAVVFCWRTAANDTVGPLV